MYIMLHMCLSKALTSNACFLTTYSNKEKQNYFKSISASGSR